MLPFLFWRVSIGRRRSPPSGAAEVSRGEPGVIPLTCCLTQGVAQSADVTLLPGVYFRPHYAAYRKPYYARKTTTALSKRRPYLGRF